MIHCTIGIMAYNEAANIGRLLQALLEQQTRQVEIDEIVVVASGCTDDTEAIVASFTGCQPPVRLLTQTRREGKASAINLLLRNVVSEVVVLQSADTLPLPHSIEALVSPFEDSKVGMVGGHPVPANSKDTFMGFGIHILWELHHQISLSQPKMGELIAFRRVFRQIPYETAVDEASIEPLIVGQGLRMEYAPDAIVRNKGPESVKEFLIQRRRIFAGHLYVSDTLGYRVSTMNAWWIAALFLKNLKADWRYWVWGTGIGLLEMYSRWLASYDYKILHRKDYTWQIAASTKDLKELPKV
jgi:poly-beta-1,6-N-acetyl-D-glucosamine synthase